MSVVDGGSALGVELGAALDQVDPVGAVAIVAASGARCASVGAAPSADYEIGSVSKAVTGLLYAEPASAARSTRRRRWGRSCHSLAPRRAR